jgi:hypothetical protein
MWALEHPAPRARSLLADTPGPLLGVLGGLVAFGFVVTRVVDLPAPVVSAVGVASGHGALLATALAWARDGQGTSRGVVPRDVLVMLVLLGVAGGLGALGPLGAPGYLGPALWLGWIARGGRLAGLGLRRPEPARAVALGAVAGLGLGVHLLVAASLTVGHHARLVPPPADYLSALAYDVGINVPAAECFFRGALFDRAQRRWPATAATAVATGPYLVRYLLDPLLPRSAAFVVGAAFYLSILGTLNCWLFRWSGALWPGLASALGFFAAYRLLGTD